VKCAIRASGVFLGVSGKGVSESVAIKTVGGAFSLDRFLEFESL